MSEYGTPPPPPGPEGGSYGQMPQMDPSQAPSAAPVTRPPAMDQAVLLMKVGAGLSLLGLLLSLFMRDAIRQAVEKSNNGSLTASQVDTAVTVGTATGIVFGLVGVGLWLWMASANGKGKSWARIVATVFFAISVLGLLSTLVQAGPLLSKLINVVSVLLGAYIIVLLYKKESSEFYQASSAPRA
ncbi:hypothetical protein [Phycicoccus sp. Root101]|uniref:hypothetical protein n=1 Tax=Phycicoccus sp. Root101 TaxID=1736421 RepID=UPI000A415DF4|nr:hypothetical protein [Phycicoccus sp. Root101]